MGPPARVGVLVSGPVLGAKDGQYMVKNNPPCGYFLDAYARIDFSTNPMSVPPLMFEYRGWINGYLSAYNKLTPNGKLDILGSMSVDREVINLLKLKVVNVYQNITRTRKLNWYGCAPKDMFGRLLHTT